MTFVDYSKICISLIFDEIIQSIFSEGDLLKFACFFQQQSSLPTPNVNFYPLFLVDGHVRILPSMKVNIVTSGFEIIKDSLLSSLKKF